MHTNATYNEKVTIATECFRLNLTQISIWSDLIIYVLLKVLGPLARPALVIFHGKALLYGKSMKLLVQPCETSHFGTIFHNEKFQVEPPLLKFDFKFSRKYRVFVLSDEMKTHYLLRLIRFFFDLIFKIYLWF